MAKRSSQGFDWQSWWNNHEDLFLYGSHRSRVQATRGASSQFEPAGNLEDVIDLLNMTLSNSEDPVIREDAALTLGRIGDERAFHSLWRVVTRKSNSLDSELMQALSMGLAHTKQSAAIGILQQVVRDKTLSLETRGIGAAALGVLGETDRDTVEFLMALVSNSGAHDELRSTAAMALGSMRGTYATEFLKSQVIQEGSVFRKSHLLSALSITCDPALTDLFLSQLHSRDQHVRWAAIIGLGGLLDGTGRLTGEKAEDVGWDKKDLAKARKKVSTILREKSKTGNHHNIKAFAALSLGRIGGAENIHSLRLLSRDAQGQHRAAVLLALGISGARDAEKDMIRLLTDSHEADKVRASACVSLALLGEASSSTRRRLQTLLARQNPLVMRHYSAISLGILRDHASATRLAKLVVKPQEPQELRTAAAVGLALLGTSNSIESVVKTIAAEDHPDIQAKLIASLGSSPTLAPASYLLDLMRDEDTSPEMKSAATHALGHIYNDHRPPIFSKFLCNRNYFLTAKPLDRLGERL